MNYNFMATFCIEYVMKIFFTRMQALTIVIIFKAA